MAGSESPAAVVTEGVARKSPAPRRRRRRLKGENLYRRLRRWLRLQYLRFLRSDSSPHKAAMGLALGVFYSVSPTFGIGGALAVGTAAIFRFSKIAAVVGSVLINPVISPFFWAFSLKLGCWLTGTEAAPLAELLERGELWSAAGEAVWAYMAGNIILSTSLSVIFYFLGHRAVRAYQRSRRKALPGETLWQGEDAADG